MTGCRSRRRMLAFLGSLAGSQLALGWLVRSGRVCAADPLYAERERLLLARPEFRRPDWPGARVLALGSSRIMGALDAARLELELGGAAVMNFAAPAAGPVTQLLYYRRLRRRGLACEVVLAEVHPAYLAANAPLIESTWLKPHRLRAGEPEALRELGWPALAAPHLCWPGRAAPVAVYRAGLLDRYAPGLRLTPSGLATDLPCDARGHLPPSPGAPPAGSPLAVRAREAARKSYAQAFDGYRVGGPGLLALRTLLGEVEGDGRRGAVIVSAEDSAFRGWTGGADLAGALAPVVAAAPAELIDAREWVPDGEFSDGHHVTGAGAARFTSRLAAELRGRGLA